MSTRGAVHLAQSEQWLAWQRDASAVYEVDAATLRRAQPWQRNEGSLLRLAAKLAAAWNARIRIGLTNADRRQLEQLSRGPHAC